MFASIVARLKSWLCRSALRRAYAQALKDYRTAKERGDCRRQYEASRRLKAANHDLMRAGL